MEENGVQEKRASIRPNRGDIGPFPGLGKPDVRQNG